MALENQNTETPTVETKPAVGLVNAATKLPNIPSGRQLGGDNTQEREGAEITSPEGTKQVTTPAEKSKFSDEVVKRAKTFGVDINGFTDEVNANFAIDQAIRATYSGGIARPGQQPQVQVPTEDEEEDDEFDASAIQDPKVAARIRKLEIANQKAQQLIDQVNQERNLERQAAVQDRLQDMAKRALKTLDGLESADFGVGEEISIPQQYARKNLMEITTGIMNGLMMRGQPIEIEDAMASALALMGKSATKAEAKAASKSLPPGTVSNDGTPTPARPYFGKARPAWDTLGISQNPNLQRGLAEIFGR